MRRKRATPPAFFKTTVADRMKDPASLEVLQSVLELISKKVEIETLQKWTPEQRAIAEDYAVRVHLAASDNIVRIPQVPAWVSELPMFSVSELMERK